MTPVVFWLDLLSPHLSAFLRSLASLPGLDVSVIVQHESLSERAALGWTVPVIAPARLAKAQTPESVSGLLDSFNETAVHIVGGLRGGALARHVLREGGRRRLRMGLLSEAADGRGWHGILRRAVYGAAALRFGRCFDFVLGMGSYGTEWFRQCGFRGPMFPFAYVTETDGQVPPPCMKSAQESFQFLYVGQMIPRKGIDILLRAFATLRHENVRLNLTGTGRAETEYRRMAASLGLADHVALLAPAPNHVARRSMQHADCLVLPSRHDGWGAVVNEALQAGTPVICSDRCGARDLLRESWRGRVFPAASVAELAKALRCALDRGAPSPALRARITLWSACTSGENLARYFRAIIGHIYDGEPRPAEPWAVISAERVAACRF
jgi:hypothetical protein